MKVELFKNGILTDNHVYIFSEIETWKPKFCCFLWEKFSHFCSQVRAFTVHKMKRASVKTVQHVDHFESSSFLQCWNIEQFNVQGPIIKIKFKTKLARNYWKFILFKNVQFETLITRESLITSKVEKSISPKKPLIFLRHCENQRVKQHFWQDKQ